MKRTNVLRDKVQRCSLFSVIVVAIAAIGVPVLGMSVARAAEPSIAFLNPSSFAKPANRAIVVSDGVQNSGGEGEECCRTEEGFRLSAWTSGLPADHTVFFLASQPGVRGVTEMEIPASNEGSGTTWEAWWDIPVTFLDGPATIAAYALVGEEVVASASQDVNLRHVQDTETTRLTYPTGPGDPFGTFEPLGAEIPEEGPADKQLPVGVVDHHYTVSEDSTQIRVFYTTTPPGQAPEWIQCGTNFAQLFPLDFATGGTKCKLKEAAHQPRITGVAAVIEDGMKQSGDATSVAPYIQVPQALSILENQYEAKEKNSRTEAFPCTSGAVLQVTDQLGRKVATANIDVRAQGPADNLKFGNHAVLTGGQPPDRIKNDEEEAYDCIDANGNSQPYIQGEIQRFGSADLKLFETEPSGTNSKGIWDFQLHSNSSGTTRWTAWLDEANDGCQMNDDRFTFGELMVSGGVQWSTPDAPGPAFDPETIATCVPEPDPEPSASPTGEPSPDPTIDPSPEPEPEERSITLESNKNRVRRGGKLTLSGVIDSRTSQCEDDNRVKIKIRKPRGRFRTLGVTATDSSAGYSLEVRIKGNRDFRAVAMPTPACLKARSAILKVRPGS